MTRFVDTGTPTTLTYDESGNPTLEDNTADSRRVTYTWDAENRLDTLDQTAPDDNVDLTNFYNADAQRVERSGSLGFVRHVWDGQNIHLHLHLDSGNAIVEKYAYEPKLYGNLVHAGTADRTYHFDERGSTLMLTNILAQVTDLYSYTGWGEVTADSVNTATNPFMYVGRMGYYTDDNALGKGDQLDQAHRGGNHGNVPRDGHYSSPGRYSRINCASISASVNAARFIFPAENSGAWSA